MRRYQYGKQFRTVCYACTFLPTATTTGTTTTVATVNNSTAVEQCSINDNQNCGDKDLDETNRIENLFINEKRQLVETVKLSRLIIKLKVP